MMMDSVEVEAVKVVLVIVDGGDGNGGDNEWF